MVVLWTVAILSLIAVSILTNSRLSHQMTRNAWINVEVDALAEAGFTRALLGLLDDNIEARWRVDGVGQSFTFDGVELEVSIQDELGKIDLNSASRTTLEQLFSSAGAAPGLASTLADRTLDWRSPSDLERLEGASANDYRAAGLSYLPRDGLFHSVDELNLVLGMTPEIFQKVEPGVTIYSRRPMIDRQTAPAIVLLSQPDMNEDTVIKALEQREVTASSDTGGIISRGVLSSIVPLSGRNFTITVTFEQEGRPYARSKSIMLTGDPKRPVLYTGLN